MPRFTVTFAIIAGTLDDAQAVLAERLEPDEDYGFLYAIGNPTVTADR